MQIPAPSSSHDAGPRNMGSSEAFFEIPLAKGLFYATIGAIEMMQQCIRIECPGAFHSRT